MYQYVICSDGACSHNPGPGGWAYEIFDGPHAAEDQIIASGSGSSIETTCNIMELTGALYAIEDLLDRGFPPGIAQLRLDSEYVLLGIFERMEGWSARNWKTKAKKPVANRELWERMYDIVARAKSAGWVFKNDWVKGHNGDLGNERVDTKACERRDEAAEELRSGGRSEEGTVEVHQHLEDITVLAMEQGDGLQQMSDITPEQISLLRGLLNPYVEGDVTVKDVLRALRMNARSLGIQ